MTPIDLETMAPRQRQDTPLALETRRRMLPPFTDRAIEASVNGICITDATGPDHPILYVNPAFERMSGYSADEIVGRNCRFLQDMDRDQDEVAALHTAIQAGVSCRVVLRNYRRDGTLFWNELYVSPVLDNDGTLVAFIGVQNDITRRRQLEQQISEDRFRALVQHATDLITLLDPTGTILYESPSILRILGYSVEAVTGRNVLEFVHTDDRAAVQARLAGSVAGGSPGGMFTARFRHRDGSWRHLEVEGTNLLGVPGVDAIVINSRDITERLRFEEQLRHQAFHDTLTGLPNRALFQDRLEYALARRAAQEGGTAVLFLDLDRFKVVNDSLGHEAGDRLLLGVADRLHACLRQGDVLARLGGDEFAALLLDLSDPDEAPRVAERMLAALDAPFQLDGHQVVAALSIGVTTSTLKQTSADMLRDADVALYRAKAKGRSRYDVFDESMNARALERLELEAELRQALERGEFVLYYQPKIALISGQLDGLEALVRWQHPRRGLVSPGVFIPLAEETGLIRPLGQWVLEEACRQTRRWQERMPDAGGPVTSVNLSARQFQHLTLVDDVARALASSGVDPGRIQLEITESAAMENAELAVATLHRLKALGVQLAIDDFGTGYSSLAYLKRFPVDTLKIDRAFVSGLRRASEDASIVTAVVSLGHALTLSVVAEGVETEEEAAQIAALGCEVGQGYYFARPLPAAEADAFIEQRQGRLLPLGEG